MISPNHFIARGQITLYQDGPFSVYVSALVDERAITLLQQTTYGTEGVRYRQTGQEVRINQLHQPYFFHLYQQQELIGLYCLDQRPVGFPNTSVTGYYGRYLAVRKDVQGQGFGQLLKTVAIDYIKQQTAAPYLFYSYIEAKNTRSMAASLKENFTSVARLKTFMFRRFAPSLDPRFKVASSTYPAQVLELVQNQYANYGFQNFLNINYQGHYFTLEKNGHILAGIQANPVCWTLMHIPGKLGPFIKHIAPHVPGLRRFFNPASQAFITLEGVYLPESRMDLLPVLLESVLAYFGRHTAMWQIDEKDPLIQLLSMPQMGWFSQFQPGVLTHVMTKGNGLPATIQLGASPTYVSCFDYS